MDYRLAASDVEQIAVEGVHHYVDPNEKISGCAQKLEGPADAVKILHTKIDFLIRAVKESEEVRANQDFMRRLN